MMFRNGIYRVDYRNPNDESGPRDDALVVFRDGKIIGADRHGGVYAGSQQGAGAQLETIGLHLTVPPGGELVTGFVAGAEGATFNILSRLDPTLDRQTATIDLAGCAVELSVSYLGPLPA